MQKVFIFLLFIVGIGLLFSQQIEGYFYQQEQANLLQEWEQLDLVETEEVSKEVLPVATVQDKRVVLEIPKIDLKMPVLEGSTKENLRKSITTIKKEQQVGEGNYAIAGHRSFTYGKHFNRLPELEVGDEVKVIYQQKEYVYRIKSKELVLPTDVQVIEDKESKKEVTLVTCHPMKNPTHRLIIQGELIENKEKTS
ncbi:class D sortase [Priestia taiwanensis]|uniref:Class A sortase n=1 Tax=Priestia taiwanensis TaxID=1347902 RepID=A0A917ANR7_9BACI|nr:class D sortase [Priestia taiwanensis]MBM7362534.1 sortase A [Priestia taiwanensis]GGE62998.1 class A sortase [Priestia taiwanensis]